MRVLRLVPLLADEWRESHVAHKRQLIGAHTWNEGYMSLNGSRWILGNVYGTIF